MAEASPLVGETEPGVACSNHTYQGNPSGGHESHETTADLDWHEHDDDFSDSDTELNPDPVADAKDRVQAGTRASQYSRKRNKKDRKCPGLRYLSDTEQTMKRGMECGLFTIGNLLTTKTNNPVHFSGVKRATQIIYQTYETMQVNTRYEPSSKRHYWVKLPPEQTYSVEDLGSMTRAQAQLAFEHRLSQGIKEGEPIWRMYFITLTDRDHPEDKRHFYACIFLFSHALVDGMGMSVITSDFYNLLCAHLRGEELKPPAEGMIGLAPPYEDLIPSRIIWRLVSPFSFALKYYVKFHVHRQNKLPKYFVRHSIFKAPNCRPLMLDDPSLPKRTAARVIVFSADRWDRFQQFRRQHKLTVSGLGIAILAVAFTRFAYLGDNWRTTRLAVHCLRDPRRYFHHMDLDRRAYVANYVTGGMFVALVMTPLKKSLKDYVIKRAKQVTEQIRANAAGLQTFFNSQAWMDVSSSQRLMSDFTNLYSDDPQTCGRYCMLQFSNVGEIAGDFQDGECVENIGLSDQAILGDCFCNVWTTVQGRLHWTLSWPTHLYERERVEFLVHMIRDTFELVVSQEDTVAPEEDVNGVAGPSTVAQPGSDSQCPPSSPQNPGSDSRCPPHPPQNPGSDSQCPPRSPQNPGSDSRCPPHPPQNPGYRAPGGVTVNVGKCTEV